ncbi:MAG TPA: hypothetical protein VGM12_12125 [Trebonia sp.]
MPGSADRRWRAAAFASRPALRAAVPGPGLLLRAAGLTAAAAAVVLAAWLLAGATVTYSLMPNNVLSVAFLTLTVLLLPAGAPLTRWPPWPPNGWA